MCLLLLLGEDFHPGLVTREVLCSIRVLDCRRFGGGEESHGCTAASRTAMKMAVDV